MMVASVIYTTKPTFSLEEGFIELEDEEEEHNIIKSEAQQWDLQRPLISDCSLELHGFDDPRGK